MRTAAITCREPSSLSASASPVQRKEITNLYHDAHYCTRIVVRTAFDGRLLLTVKLTKVKLNMLAALHDRGQLPITGHAGQGDNTLRQHLHATPVTRCPFRRDDACRMVVSFSCPPWSANLSWFCLLLSRSFELWFWWLCSLLTSTTIVAQLRAFLRHVCRIPVVSPIIAPTASVFRKLVPQ